MAPLTEKASATVPLSCVSSVVARGGKRVPKGYLPMVLVRDDEGGAVGACQRSPGAVHGCLAGDGRATVWVQPTRGAEGPL